MSRKRIVVDTNVLVSAIIFPSSVPGIALEKAIKEAHLIVSKETISELEEVLKREKFRKYFSSDKISSISSSLAEISDLIIVSSTIKICRDPKDNGFLALAVDGGATFIITGDEDLFILKTFESISILSPKEFISTNLSQPKFN